jgi:hypothetical protein
MARKYKIYVDMSTRNIYDRNGNQLTDQSCPYIYYKENLELEIQYLTAPPGQPPVDEDLDKYTDLAGQTITSSAAVDNNNNHYDIGVLNTGVTGAITSIVVGTLEAAPRLKTGTLLLINGAGEQESVDFTNYTVLSSVYTFTVSDTLTYTYLANDAVRVKETPIIKSEDAAIDDTDKDTGLFLIGLDGYTQVFQQLAEGNDSIASCKFEHQILDVGGDLVFAVKFSFICLGLLDDSGVIPPAPDDDYYTKTQVDAIAAGKADIVGADDIEITDATKGLILKDRTTAARYRLFFDNGILSYESIA